MKTLVEMKSKDIKPLKQKWYDEADGICPVLKKKVEFDKCVIDHQHKLKSELPDETGKGICRGAIEFRANALEGKITNNFKRLGLDKDIDLSEFLRNLADYLDSNKIDEDVLYIHPNEVPKEKKLKKSSYNKLVKIVKKDPNHKKKIPDYPKSGKITKPLKELFQKINMEPEFYS